MSYAKTLNLIQKLKPHLVIIGERSTFGAVFSKIKNSKGAYYFLLRKTECSQMTAVLLLRLLGKKFVWIQNFTNPPPPNFWVRFLLGQADHVFAVNQKDLGRLIEMGIDKDKIRKFTNLKFKINLTLPKAADHAS